MILAGSNVRVCLVMTLVPGDEMLAAMVTALRVEQATARSRCRCLLRTPAGANRVIGATATS